MPNPYVRSIVFTSGAAIIKTDSAQYTFPIQGVSSAPVPPPVIIDPSSAIAALRADMDARIDALNASTGLGLSNILAAVNKLSEPCDCGQSPTVTGPAP